MSFKEEKNFKSYEIVITKKLNKSNNTGEKHECLPFKKKNECLHPLRVCFIIPPACRRMDRQLIRAPELVGGGPLDSLTVCAA